LVLFGCGGDSSSGPAQVDAAVDAASQVVVDAPLSGPDAALDVSSAEPPPDGTVDLAPPPDAAPPDETPDAALPDLGAADASPDAAIASDAGGACTGTSFGPDSYGYTGCATTPVVSPCDDISATGTDALLPDDDYVYVPIGFAFDFYGTPYGSVAINSNGTLHFADLYLDYFNICIPGDNGDGVSEFIAVFWDDLYPPAPGGSVRYLLLGSAPSRRFVIQWKTSPCCSGSDLIDVRAVLHEGSNGITVCYVDTYFADPFSDYGVSATTGLQQNNTSALQYSCDTAALSNGLVLEYSHP